MKKFCVLDTETGGLDSSIHSVLELAIVPLNEDLTTDLSIEPFYARIKNYTYEVSKKALEVNGLDPNEGDSPYKVVYDFVDWMRANKIEKINPLGQNWKFDEGFIRKLLTYGGEEFEDFFHYHFEDTCSTARAINRAHKGEFGESLFKSTSLKDLAEFFGIDYSKGHSAHGDCIVTAKVYKELLRIIKTGTLFCPSSGKRRTE